MFELKTYKIISAVVGPITFDYLRSKKEVDLRSRLV